MFKSKHVITALIVAPILAIISYVMVDKMVSETPHAANPNASYALAAKPNCRYASGECTLKNGEFLASLIPAVSSQGEKRLQVVSRHPVDGVKIAFSNRGEDVLPQELRQTDNSGLEWEIPVPTHVDESALLRIVLLDGSTSYFAEVAAVFLESDTTLSR